MSDESKSLTITTVKPGSQAMRLSIRAGDKLLSYNDSKVTTNASLTEAAKVAKGYGKASVNIVILRGHEEIEIAVSTAEPLGIDCAELTGKASVSQAGKESPYTVARVLMVIWTIVGWLLVLLGFIVMVQSSGQSGWVRQTNLTLLPGLMVTAFGFISIASAQLGLAVLDNADSTAAILRHLISKDSNKGDS